MNVPSKSCLKSWTDCDIAQENLYLEETVSRLKNKYANNLEPARTRIFPEKNGRKWCSQKLEHNDDWILAHLVIAPNETIPLHDHPGSAGAHLVLAGSAFHYQFTVLGQNQGTWLLRQERLATRRLKINDIVSFSSVKGNAHSFAADSDGCVLLNISCHTNEPGHWYCPINDIQSHALAAIRIRR